jgi:site-specific DNA recombinase
MKAAVLYARVSSREQEREGYSIPAQLKLLKQYASRNDIHIEREFLEVESAKTPGRPRFEEMVRFLRATPKCRIVLVEKTDRLYRNFRDAVTLQDLNAEIHLVKESQIVSEESKSPAKLIHGIQLVIAKNYADNLREEVKKGMREKAEQGIYPGRAPFGYRNNSQRRDIETHPENSRVVKRMFELYATGEYSLRTLREKIIEETGVRFSRSYLETILKNRFYLGNFEWQGIEYSGKHEPLISPEAFESVQRIFSGHNKGKYRKHRFPFSGMLRCAHDGCTVTTELHKGKYVYYRCSYGRGKCDLPYMREENLSEKLGEILKGIYVPENVAELIASSLQSDMDGTEVRRVEQLNVAKQQLARLQARLDKVYEEHLDGKISDDLWERKSAEYRDREMMLEAQVQTLSKPINAEHALTVARILELANKAYSLYLTRNSEERAELLRMVLLNCATDGVSVMPTYRKPFDMIFQRAQREEWSGREDLNLRPPGPEPGALPG